MAEAVVVESPMQKFFCHKCTQEINLVLPDFTCPRCQSGFIEELSEGLHDNASDVPDEDLDMEYHIREVGRAKPDLVGKYKNGLLQAALLDALRRADYDHGRSSADNHHSNLRDSSQLDPGIFRRVGGGQHRNTGFYRQPSQENPSSRHSLEGIIHQVFASLFGDADVLGNGAIPMFFNLHGNPGDYAWGRESLDSIITELLNRIDGTGPPPLPKEKIAEIPTVQIAEELVEKNLQCTVCMEDFKLGEPVKKLSCQHHYHNECIIPWLELHGTCPVCRKVLLDEQNSSSASEIPFVRDRSPSFESSGLGPTRRSRYRRNTPRNPSSNNHSGSIYDFTDGFD